MTLLHSLLLASAATFLPLCLASSHSENHYHHPHHGAHRRQVIPLGWTSKGCYTDGVGGRTLAAAGFNSGTMTTEACVTYCSNHGYIYAGTEYGVECFCDNHFQAGGAPTADSECNFNCPGNAAEKCGAGNRLNVYWSNAEPPPMPSAPEHIGDWASLGCYSDNVNGARSLGFGVPASNQMTNEACTTACFNAGYHFSGTEYAQECFCGNTINGGASIAASSCGMTCAGNNQELCGGPNALNIYNYTGNSLPTNGGGGGGGNPPPPPPPTNVYPVLSGLPGNWAYNACWVDNAYGRSMIFQQPDDPQMTVEKCVAACNGSHYKLAGLEYSTQCFCGNTLVAGAAIAEPATCGMGCGGNTTEACGGPNRLSVYSSEGGNVTALPIPKPKTTDLPGQWKYQGCLKEVVGGRALPYQIIWPTNNTAVACMNQCAAFGFTASGTEYGEECYCGDPSDIVKNNAVMGQEADCALPCPGDPTSLCGAGNRITLYYWNGTMDVWHTPENIGRYEFFMPGVVIPLITTLGINNKITLLEKTGTGYANSTGGYELDLSLVPDFSKAYRAMHPKTDVFCSGSIIMPDKGGRQINVGGWSLESTYGIRFYTPDGSPGVNGTNDWEEKYPAVALQRGRWYPTAAMLANGSIFVIGGETGSNAPSEPTMEILPKPEGGDTTIYFDWLARTDPYNLYPFVYVLPSKNVFVAYWNEARILEPVNFNTVKVLPNIPGSVNDFLGGRTYPLAGTGMIFPQHAPYTDPLTFIACGGSTIGAGLAIDNCVTIQPEVENAAWTLERMPSKRVMPSMVGLPDGTFMIMNGAHQGVAGFGLATDPNLSALLYDPYKPLGQRISILNNTIVARLYHSELTLLPDGRVMVSGSDPQTYAADGSEIFPEEFRLEVYVPPYLNQGFRQPEFDITDTDWAYSGQYTINNIKLYQGSMANIRISLLSATSSTHGNTMGGRTIFPAFTCSGNSCTITAPPHAGVSPPAWHTIWILDGPTPSHAKWVRIGGDPSRLGEWPNVPGFTRPGV